MAAQPLTSAQTRVVQQLQQDAQTPAFVVAIVSASMRLRNASSRSSLTSKADAEQDLFKLIDEVS